MTLQHRASLASLMISLATWQNHQGYISASMVLLGTIMFLLPSTKKGMKNV